MSAGLKVERIRGSDYIIHYPTFEALRDDRPKTTVNNQLDAQTMKHYASSSSWFGPGLSRAEDLLPLADKGWDTLVAAVKRKAEDLVFKPDVMPVAVTTGMRRTRVRAEAGNELDIHRVYQGRTDVAWSSTRHELKKQRRRAVHIYVNIGGLGDVDAIDSQWRAAATYRICELFQRNGYTVEITVGATASEVFPKKPGMLCHTSFTAKPSGMPLNLNRLAIQATMAWHRVFNFHARCCNDKGYQVSSGFGWTRQMPSPHLEGMPGVLITIPANTLSRDMAMGVVRLAQKTLEEAAQS